MPFCPNCSAKLASEAVSECWNCKASFSSPSAWRPVASSPGEFRKFTNAVGSKTPSDAADQTEVRSTGRKIAEGAALTLLGTFIGALALAAWLFSKICYCK